MYALLIEAAAAVPRPYPMNPEARGTEAVLRAHNRAIAARDIEPTPADPGPAVYWSEPSCGQCGAFVPRGLTHCPECSTRLA